MYRLSLVQNVKQFIHNEKVYPLSYEKKFFSSTGIYHFVYIINTTFFSNKQWNNINGKESSFFKFLKVYKYIKIVNR